MVMEHHLSREWQQLAQQGHAAYLAGNLQEAEFSYVRVLRRVEADPSCSANRLGQLSALLGEVYIDRGDFPAAEYCYRKALEAYSKCGGAYGVEIAVILRSLSDACREQGKQFESGQYNRRAKVSLKRYRDQLQRAFDCPPAVIGSAVNCQSANITIDACVGGLIAFFNVVVLFAWALYLSGGALPFRFGSLG